MLENNVLGGNNMTPEEAEKAKTRAKKEIETLSIYLGAGQTDLGG